MKKTAGPAQRNARSILLVDDNPHGLVARRTLLEERGYQIATATSGEEALERFAAGNFDLMVTDYKMPGMNGAELIARVKELYPSMATILLSGFVEALGLTEKSTGADIVLSKSAGEAGHLVRSVARLLDFPARKPAGSLQQLRNRSSGLAS